VIVIFYAVGAKYHRFLTPFPIFRGGVGVFDPQKAPT
jgi:hypothetical protein